MRSPAAVMRQALRDAAQTVLITDESGRSVTGQDLEAAVSRVAGLIGGAGPPGTPIGVWYRNSIEAYEAFLAVEWIGGTRVPVDPGATAEEALSVFLAAECRVVLADESRAAALNALRPVGLDVVIHDRDHTAAGPPRDPEPDVPADQPLHLYPRAVVDGELVAVPITYAAWDWTLSLNARMYADGRYGDVVASPSFLTVQQLMHGTSMLGSFSFLRCGWAQVVHAGFDPAAVLAAIDRHGITSTMVVAGMVPPLAAAAASPPVTLRHLLYGGAPITRQDLLKAIAAFPDRLVQVYGRLEGGWPIAVLDQHDHRRIAEGDDAVAKSCGRPIAEIELRLGSGDGQSPSELWVRSPAVSPDFANPDGWCSLGDLMHVDAGGYLTITGRTDRMINTGYHVDPAEVESVIRGVDGVVDVVVSGVPDPVRGQRVSATVEIATSHEPDAVREAINQVLARSLARYKHPRELKLTAGGR